MNQTATSDCCIETIRLDEVKELIRQLIKEADIDDSWENDFFSFIYKKTRLGLSINPEQLLFNSDVVSKILESIKNYIPEHRDQFEVEEEEEK